MNGYVKMTGQEKKMYSPSFINENTFHQPIRIGLWNDGFLSWKYPYSLELDDYSDSFFSVSSLTCTTEYEITKIQLNNVTNEQQHLKVIIEYNHSCDHHSMAFYSPSEKAIMEIANNHVTLLGGVLGGRGMSQYCIHKKEFFQSYDLKRSLERGNLPLSMLADGDINSIFFLEADLRSGEQMDGIIWTFKADSEEQTRLLKNEKIAKYV